MNEADEEQFRALLAEHWHDALSGLGETGRARLEELLAATGPTDPTELRAELEDLLLDALPPDHPLIVMLRNRFRFDAGAARPDPSEGRSAAIPLRDWLSARLPAAAPEEEPWTWMHRRVRERLLALPWRPGEDAAIARWRDLLVRLDGPSGLQVPTFQLDEEGHAWPELLEVNRLLDAGRDPWGVCCWWVDPHAELGHPPVDLLGTDRASWLVPLARRTVED